MPVDPGTLPRVDPGQFGAVGGRDRRADRTVALSYTGALTQTACWEGRSQVCDEICLTLAEVRRRTPSAVPAWGPRGTTPRLTVRETAAGAPPPPPPHHTTPHHTTPHHTTPHHTTPHHTTPHHTTPHHTTPHHTTPHHTTPHHTTPYHTTARHTPASRCAFFMLLPLPQPLRLSRQVYIPSEPFGHQELKRRGQLHTFASITAPEFGQMYQVFLCAPEQFRPLLLVMASSVIILACMSLPALVCLFPSMLSFISACVHVLFSCLVEAHSMHLTIPLYRGCCLGIACLRNAYPAIITIMVCSPLGRYGVQDIHLPPPPHYLPSQTVSGPPA